MLQGEGAGYVDTAQANSLDAIYQPGRVSLPQSAAGRVPLSSVLPPDLQSLLEDGIGLLRSPSESQAALEESNPSVAMDPVLRLRGFQHGEFHPRAARQGSGAIDQLDRHQRHDGRWPHERECS